MIGTTIWERVLIAPRKLQKAAELAAEAALSGEQEVLLISQARVARMLNCSRFTVRRLVRTGALHPVNIRGLVRYRVSELKTLAEHGAGGGEE